MSVYDFQKRLNLMTSRDREIWDLASKAVNAMGFACQMAGQQAENSQLRYEEQSSEAMAKLFELLAPQLELVTASGLPASSRM